MGKTCILVIGSLIYSLASFAGEYSMSDTGRPITGLRGNFSEPVTFTNFRDVLKLVEPQSELAGLVANVEEHVYTDGMGHFRRGS